MATNGVDVTIGGEFLLNNNISTRIHIFLIKSSEGSIQIITMIYTTMIFPHVSSHFFFQIVKEFLLQIFN